MKKWTPREYQRMAVAAVGANERLGLFLDPGLGKTSIVLSAFTRLRELLEVRRMLVVAPLRVAYSVWPQEAAKWEHLAGLRVVVLHGPAKEARLGEDADVYVINPEGLKWLAPKVKTWRRCPTMLVVDECFPAGTPVATPEGERPIETLREGDAVVSSDGPRRIKRVFQGWSQVLLAVRLTDGRKIEATPGHPFLTRGGWRRADALRPGMDVCDMRVCLQGLPPSGAEASEVLLSAVRGDGEAGPPELECRETHEVGSSPEAVRFAEGHRPSAPGSLRAPGADGTRSASPGGSGARMGVGTPGHHPPRWGIPGALPDRCGQHQGENSRGVGRPKPQGVDSSCTRSKAGRLPGFARVESVSVSQFRHPVEVFNLEIEGLPHYIASGIVVHNSTKFKAIGSQRSRALARMLPRFARRYILTGTPAPNGYRDLYGQVRLLDDGAALGATGRDYLGRYFMPIQKGQWVDWQIRPGAAQRIEEAMTGLVLRLDARDLLDLPDLVEVDMPVALPPKARQAYDRFRDQMVLALAQGEVTAVNAGVLVGKCRQIANGAVYLDDMPGVKPDGETRGRGYVEVHQEKIKAVVDLVEDLGGKPVLVAYEFAHDLARLKKALGDPPHIGSRISAAEGVRLEKRWNEGKLPVLLVQAGSVAHGLNLQAGGHVMVWFTVPWDLEVYQQSVRRLYRQGQTERVLVYRLEAERTVDRVVLDTLRDKDARQRSLLDALKKELEA